MFVRPTFRRGWAGGSRRIFALLTLALGVLPALAPHSASAFDADAGACLVYADLTVSGGSITSWPATEQVNVSLSGPCLAEPVLLDPMVSGSVVSIPAASVSCDLLNGVGNAVFQWAVAPPPIQTATAIVEGSLAHSYWAFANLTDLHFAATADLTWANAAEMTRCRLGGITEAHLVGVLVYEDPKVP
ncbi:MAG TPA: hypothetical protein VG245_00305 [Candidatus Dormibacteraeota bacterium]|nr:hypothetical protein [Candidatus Dormibacteraeota bacterium]